MSIARWLFHLVMGRHRKRLAYSVLLNLDNSNVVGIRINAYTCYLWASCPFYSIRVSYTLIHHEAVQSPARE